MKNWPSCTESAEPHRNGKILQILFCSIALSSSLMAATAAANAEKHFRVKQHPEI